MQGETQAKLLERRNEVGAQLRNMGAAPAVPATLPPTSSDRSPPSIALSRRSSRADAQKTVDDYNATKSDLDQQFAALHGADVGATGAAANELAALQKRRAGLYKQIGDQITRDT